MNKSAKPVRKCHGCLLNLGERCWHYHYPRGQWRQGRHCAARDDEALHARFRTWQKQPSVKTRRELRQEFCRTKKKDQPFALWHPMGSRTRQSASLHDGS